MSEPATLARHYRRPVIVFVVGVLLAASTLVWRDHARRPRYVVTVQKQAAPPYVVLAGDCPANDQCQTTGARSSTVRLVVAAFPGLPTDLPHAALRDQVSVYRETIDVSTASGVRVREVARCVEHGSAARAAQSTSVPSTGPATVFVVVPGRSGCSVAVVLRVPAGVPVPWTAATALAHRSELQL